MARRIVLAIVALGVIGLVVGGFYGYRQRNSAQQSANETETGGHEAPLANAAAPVKLSAEARKNLGLVTKRLQTTNYWRSIEIPGVVTDRPGISDRGVVAPVTGIVTKIHAHPGDLVKPESPLFSLRLVSESLNESQLELFKATKEIEIAKKQKQRLNEVAESGAVPRSRITDLDNQIERMEVNVQAYQQDLLARGLPLNRIEAAASGEFLTEITVRAPGEQTTERTETVSNALPSEETEQPSFSFELHELKVELGQQVEAGEVLCRLADHRALFIEGRAFRNDLPLIQQAALEHLPVAVRFDVENEQGWSSVPHELQIHHVANVVDEASRTFAFYLALENQWRVYNRDGQERLLWRYRPGDRVRLAVAVEELKDVYVLPKRAVVSEGADSYVFRQNGDFFDRIPVHMLHQDSTSVVLAPDGALRPGFFVAQNAAASLNRILKSQASSGMPANVHVHADGTVHAAH